MECDAKQGIDYHLCFSSENNMPDAEQKPDTVASIYLLS